jgi:hypothetical protein
MLTRTVTTVPRANGQPVTYLTGRALRRMTRGKKSKQLAEIAARLLRYGVTFDQLSAAQVCRLVGANPGAVSTALGNAGKRGPRVSTLDRLIKRHGPDVLMKAVDRATAPRVAAE